jgi:hypothetical protein
VQRSVRDKSTWIVTYLHLKAMLGISLYSCPYLNLQKCDVFLIIAYFYSSRELEKRAKQVLPGNEGGRGDWVEAGSRGEK